jgi:hypothetical protein
MRRLEDDAVKPFLIWRDGEVITVRGLEPDEDPAQWLLMVLRTMNTGSTDAE